MDSAESTQEREFSRRGRLAAIRCNAFLFDLDGVLIDSTPAVQRVWAQWAMEHGFDPDAVVAHAHGDAAAAQAAAAVPIWRGMPGMGRFCGYWRRVNIKAA